MAGIPAATGGAGLKDPVPGANKALALLLVINLFNYIDRQVLSAVLPRLQLDGTIIAPDDPNAQLKLGALTSAFMVTYMLFSPIVGWLDGRGVRRWLVLGLGVTGWSLASGSSGLAAGYWTLLATRCLVGVGEGAYGPVASAMLADLYPVRQRGWVMAAFNMAIPVGSALGFVIGGLVAGAFNDWRPAFYVTYIGLALGLICFLMREPPRQTVTGPAGATAPNYLAVLRTLTGIRSFVLCCAGMTAITFVIGGVAAWVPAYIYQREARFTLTAEAIDRLPQPTTDLRAVPADVAEKLRPMVDGTSRTLPELKAGLVRLLPSDEAALYTETIADQTRTAGPDLVELNVTFGAILVVGGLLATVVGAWLGERLRTRIRGAYFWVIGGGALAALPSYLALLYVPFPTAWVFVFLTIFGLFLHTGPAFTTLANVTTSNIRATAFAINILVIHALGDAISPTLIGWVADMSSLQTAFLMMSVMILLGSGLWAAGSRFLDEDTRRAEGAPATASGAEGPTPQGR